MVFQKKVIEEMKSLNLNQKKLMADGIVNLSVANVSICIITPLLYKFNFEVNLLLLIFVVIIMSILMSIYAISLLKK